jgi:hypothetical protein
LNRSNWRNGPSRRYDAELRQANQYADLLESAFNRNIRDLPHLRLGWLFNVLVAGHAIHAEPS